jgi:cytochrome P450
VSAVRIGDKTPIIFNGVSYPTMNEMVWIQTHSLHRRPDLFPSPDEFIPERFLPAPNNFQEIPKDAWRPFEKGPRACLGQELAMLEIKIALALTLRDFDIEDGYEDWDRKLGREKPGETLGGKRGMFGEKSFKYFVPMDEM